MTNTDEAHSSERLSAVLILSVFCASHVLLCETPSAASETAGPDFGHVNGNASPPVAVVSEDEFFLYDSNSQRTTPRIIVIEEPTLAGR